MQPVATHCYVGRAKCGHIVYVSTEEPDNAGEMATMFRDLAKITKAGGTYQKYSFEDYRANINKIHGTNPEPWLWCDCPKSTKRK